MQRVFHLFRDGVFGLLRNGERVVRVVVSLRGKRQNGAGLDVHQNGRAALQRAAGLKARLQMLFYDALCGLVDREHKVVAVLCLHILVILERHVIALCVLRADKATRRAGKLAVVFRFNARKTLVIRASEAEHRRSRGAVGIIAFVVFHQRDAAADLFVLDILHDLIAHLGLHLALDIDKVAVLLRFF